MRTPLPRVQPLLLQLHALRALLHYLFAFREDQFDVAWVRHVGVDLFIQRLSALTNMRTFCKDGVGVWICSKGEERDIRDHEHDTYGDAAWAPG